MKVGIRFIDYFTRALASDYFAYISGTCSDYLGSCHDCFRFCWILSSSFQDHPRITQLLFWDQFRIISGSVYCHVGIIVGPFWDPAALGQMVVRRPPNHVPVDKSVTRDLCGARQLALTCTKCRTCRSEYAGAGKQHMRGTDTRVKTHARDQ